MCSMGLSGYVPFPVPWDLPGFQRKTSGNGGTGESNSSSYWICSGSCRLVMMALAELLSAQSVFPEKGRSWAFGKLSLLRGASVPWAMRLLCLRTPGLVRASLLASHQN